MMDRVVMIDVEHDGKWFTIVAIASEYAVGPDGETAEIPDVLKQGARVRSVRVLTD